MGGTDPKPFKYFIKNAIIAKVTTFGRLHLWKLFSSVLTCTTHHSRHAVNPHHLLSALLYAQPTGLEKNENQT